MKEVRVSNLKIISFLSVTLDKAFHSYYKRLSIAKFMFSEVAVHNLRISMRKAIAICSLINFIIPNYYSEELIAHLRRKMRFLNDLRDIQVELLKIERLNSSGTAISEFKEYLRISEKEQLAKAKSNINSFYNNSIHTLYFMLKVRINDCMHEDIDLKSNLVKYIENSYEVLKLKFRQINNEDFKSFHCLRLEFKNYRYSLEHIVSYLEKSTVLVLRLKHFQDLLGKIQDNTVFLKRVDKYLETVKKPEISLQKSSKLSLTPLIKIIDDERYKAMQDIYINKRAFYSLNSGNFIKKLNTQKKTCSL